MKIWDEWMNSLSAEEIMVVTQTMPNYDQTDFQYKLECLDEWNKLYSKKK